MEPGGSQDSINSKQTRLRKLMEFTGPTRLPIEIVKAITIVEIGKAL